VNRCTGLASLAVVVMFAAGCGRAPGQRAVEAAGVTPDSVLDFATLFSTNCAACHGTGGLGGASIALANPLYLALADDVALRRAIAEVIPGTPMPAFARGSGGLLTDGQVGAIVTGMRTRWTDPSAVAGLDVPPYTDSSPGDPRRGGDVFVTYCARCHGARGEGASGGSSIVDGSYLALVSDQGLRTIVIAGRPELGAPDWRGNASGKAMAPREITDVVAWLSAQRPAFPGRPY
jgi:cytochrome c oxidase cbb3-type subunit 3